MLIIDFQKHVELTFKGKLVKKKGKAIENMIFCIIINLNFKVFLLLNIVLNH